MAGVSTLKYWVWLASLDGVAVKTLLNLLEHFGSPEKVFFASESDYEEVEGIKGSDIKRLTEKNLVLARKIIADCEENDYRIITLGDAEYPARLKNIFDPPIVLYVSGRLPVMDEEAAIAVVGTRKCTPYGIKAAERIGYELTKAGCLVVSGLARGIDTASAMGVLRAGGRVVGVIGSGLDVVYPKENKKLYDDVCSTGAIVSEYPPGTQPDGWHFPARNRIMSGMSVGITVIEAPKSSGALITASRALEQGRDIFAVPGNIDSPACEGSNTLLREGAILVTSGHDIAEEYVALYPEKLIKDKQTEEVPLDNKIAGKLVKRIIGAAGERKPEKRSREQETPVNIADVYAEYIAKMEGISEIEMKVISAINAPETFVDDIIISTELPAQTVLSTLTMLEIDGHIIQESGKRFSLNI